MCSCPPTGTLVFSWCSTLMTKRPADAQCKLNKGHAQHLWGHWHHNSYVYIPGEHFVIASRKSNAPHFHRHKRGLFYNKVKALLEKVFILVKGIPILTLLKRQVDKSPRPQVENPSNRTKKHLQNAWLWVKMAAKTKSTVTVGPDRAKRSLSLVCRFWRFVYVDNQGFLNKCPLKSIMGTFRGFKKVKQDVFLRRSNLGRHCRYFVFIYSLQNEND